MHVYKLAGPTHIHTHTRAHTHPGVAAVALDTKERTIGVSGCLQVANTDSKELIHCGETRPSDGKKKRKRHYIHVQVIASEPSTHRKHPLTYLCKK